MYRFCRMIYDRGAWAGSRILSPEAVDRMTTTQTGTLMVTPPNDAWGYGFGWLTRRREERRNDPVSLGAFGAGGAYNCGMWINRHRGVMAVWMVQQAGFAEPERNRVRTAFTDAAVARFGN